MPSFNFKNTFKSLKKSKEIKKTKSINYLINFGLAEFGSALDMLAAAELTHNKKLKKGYLNHAIDEFRHAEMFFDLAKKYSKDSYYKHEKNSPISELGEKIRYLNFIGEKPIYSELKELDFITFVMISEQAAQKYFLSLSSNKNFNNEMRELFKIIAYEEGHHVIYAKKELDLRKKLGHKGIKKSYYYIKWYRFKTDFLSNSRKYWVLIGNGLLNFIFYLFIPITKLFSKKNYIEKNIDPYSMT